MGQINVGKQVATLHLAYDVGQATGPLGQKAVVDLVWVTGDDDARVATGPGQQSFHLVSAEVLGFVYDDIGVVQGTATDEIDRQDGHATTSFVVGQGIEVRDFFTFLLFGHRLGDDFIGITDRTLVGIELFIKLPGQKTDIVANLVIGPEDIDLARGVA